MSSRREEEVVVDTNVWIRAAFRKMRDYQVWKLVEQQLITAVCLPEMVRELELASQRKAVREGPITSREREVLEDILGELVDVSDRRPRVHVSPDTIEGDYSDLVLIQAALRVITVPVPILTHDKDLLDGAPRLERRLGIEVLQPYNFLRNHASAVLRMQ